MTTYTAWPSGRLPDGLPEAIRKELPSLVDEVVTDIRTSVPEYRRSLGGPYGRSLRAGAERILEGFANWLTGPPESLAPRDEFCHRIGEFEAREGRELDALHAALRIASQTAWHRVVDVVDDYGFDAVTVTLLADAMLNYLNELAELCREGYQAAKARIDEDLVSRRRWLLHLLVDPAGVDPEVLADQALAADWKVPDLVTPIAVLPGVPVVRAVLDEDVLLDLAEPEPLLLVPGPLTPERREMLHSAIDEGHGAAGLSVEVDRAAHSLRWARLTMRLVRDGILDDGPLTLSEDHLVTLALFTDPGLVERMSARLLAPLRPMPERRRRRYTDTLRAMLRSRGTAQHIADDLGIHEQTVHYRMRQIEEVFGDRLTDPDARFATEVALRAEWLRTSPTAPPTDLVPTDLPDPPPDTNSPISTAAVYPADCSAIDSRFRNA